MYQPYALRSARPKYEATSPGERLWFAIRDWWFDREAYESLAIDRSALDWTDERRRVGYALANTAVSDACVRLIRRAKSRLDRCDLSSTPADTYRSFVADDVKQYCVSPMGLSFADPILAVITHLAFDCAVVARKTIASQTRKSIHLTAMAGRGRVGCYVCDVGLVRPYALDHLWPQSLGGISDEENLLPICGACNGRKMDRVGWHTFGVLYDYANLNGTSDGTEQANMALHHRAATKLAELNRSTIREAFIELGPVRPRTLIDPDERDDWFFNLNAHDASVLPELWS